MITKERFQQNFQYLQTLIPLKPEIYTKDYPKNIEEAFHYYLRQSSLNMFQQATVAYNTEEWPLPLWFDPDHIRLGFLNRLNYNKTNDSFRRSEKKKSILDLVPLYNRIFKHFKKIPPRTAMWEYILFPSFNQIFFKKDFGAGIITAFDCNLAYLEQKLKANPNLTDKNYILNDVFHTYKKGYYIASITTLFPLLDYIARKFLKITRLHKGVGEISKLFAFCGFDAHSTDHLMPHVAISQIMHRRIEENGSIKGWEEEAEDIKEVNLGLIGPILSSFLRFSNIYYSDYKDEAAPITSLNRHAILHGSLASFGSKVNTIKLITFLYLFLELEPVFAILLNEE